MTRQELNTLKEKALRRREKASDMDILIAALLAMPHGQLKKALTEDVLAVLQKYGYTEDGA